MVSSCLVLAVRADGTDIMTIEGLAQNGQLDPLQQSFIDCGGFQCGICTLGMIMAAKALLDHNPTPYRGQHQRLDDGQPVSLHGLLQNHHLHSGRRNPTAKHGTPMSFNALSAQSSAFWRERYESVLFSHA